MRRWIVFIIRYSWEDSWFCRVAFVPYLDYYFFQWIALDWKPLEHVFYDIWNTFFLHFEHNRLLPYISIPWKSPNLFYSNLCVLHSYRTWHVSWATSTPCYDVGLTAVKLNIIEVILKREAKIPRYLRLLVNSEEIRNVLIFLNCHVVNISHC